MRKYKKNNVEEDLFGLFALISLLIFFKYWKYVLGILIILILYKIIVFIVDLDLKSNFKTSKIYYQGTNGKENLKKLELEQKNGVNNEYKINCLKRGIYGEERVLYTLSNSDIPMYIMYDLVLECGDYKAQIDFVLVSKRNIYFLETKNLKGNIDIEDDGTFTRRLGKYKKGIKNPLTQNNEHEKVIKAIFKKEKIHTSFKSLVVLANDNNYIKFKKNAKSLSNNIIRNDKLEETLKKYEQSKHIIRQEDKIKNICDVLLKYNNAVEKNDDELIELLKKYRKETSYKEKTYPYMIYNDETLIELVKIRPKSLEELKNISGFGDYKIEKYGNDIIKIINDK